MRGCCCSLGNAVVTTPWSGPRRPTAPLCVASHNKPISTSHLLLQNIDKMKGKADEFLGTKKAAMLAAQIGAVFATLEEPGWAVTGVNNEPEFTRTVIDLGLVTVWYFLIMPPIIMNWLRVRWYRRKFVEMYFQFMFVFMFFPGLLVWAPFLNFRKFPRDPSLKYPWERPKDPSKVKSFFLKYPFADPDDYA
ncbi:PREDICTED: NAD(P)H-quinone oxidoreductase subunit L, chloroplastic isoform X1 [Tarenaya hassleriana]|uniref:NAD(P)H-quinone oxidoreductase subunit L, chloroplastic isoform X1 n=1 Tax=Tarenaya hassleriana TaxID=28532 RepID=UPI00053C7145|nr:PREDICTED: NAD(P)H-quinone oxidoreductase subunit L, chloroplastic isoform X1 [Tarenaya hassleriana]